MAINARLTVLARGLSDDQASVYPFNHRLGNPQHCIAASTAPHLTSLYLQHPGFVTENSDYRARAEFPKHREVFGCVMGLRSWGTSRRFFDCQIEFRIAPGPYSFTLASDLGKTTMPLLVDSWTPGKLALSSIVLSREIHPAADLGLGPLTVRRTPLVAEGTQVVPFGSTQFRRAEAGWFYFEVYDSDPSSVRVRVRVLDKSTGESKWDSGVTKLPIPANGGKPSLPASSRLPFDLLATGSYQLEITASDSTGTMATRTTNLDLE